MFFNVFSILFIIAIFFLNFVFYLLKFLKVKSSIIFYLKEIYQALRSIEDKRRYKIFLRKKSIPSKFLNNKIKTSFKKSDPMLFQELYKVNLKTRVRLSGHFFIEEVLICEDIISRVLTFNNYLTKVKERPVFTLWYFINKSSTPPLRYIWIGGLFNFFNTINKICRKIIKVTNISELQNKTLTPSTKKDYFSGAKKLKLKFFNWTYIKKVNIFKNLGVNYSTFSIRFKPVSMDLFLNPTFNLNFLFIRSFKVFNKGRYSRNRQYYRTGVYWCLYLNIIAVIGMYFWFYRFAINFGYIWWLFLFFIVTFFFSRFIKYWPFNIFFESNNIVAWFGSVLLIVYNLTFLFVRLLFLQISLILKR